MSQKSKIKFLSVPIGAPATGRREISAVVAALKEKRLSQGKYVQAFEKAWSSYVGKKFGIAVNSGSSANLLAILAMKERFGWKNGDGVIVPALTFATAVMPVIQAGLNPIYADVDRRANITLESVKKALADHSGAKPRGLVLVHSLGLPCIDIVKIKSWASRNGLRVLEDACESHGAGVEGERVGVFGDVSTTSFFVAHNMTTGEGGMITTDDPKIDRISRSLREFGRHFSPTGERYVRLASGPLYDSRYAFERIGYNMRLTDLEASLGLVQLDKLDAMNEKRREIAALYKKALADLVAKKFISLPDEPRGSRSTYYALEIIFEQMPKNCRDLSVIGQRLHKAGIETRPLMGGNLLRQKAFASRGIAPEKFEAAEFLHRRALLVGCHPLLSKKQVFHVADQIRELYS